jgi:hypothetical protein
MILTQDVEGVVNRVPAMQAFTKASTHHEGTRPLVGSSRYGEDGPAG